MSAPDHKPLKAKALMRPYAVFYFYRRRLRLHTVQELLAGLGVAVGVALVFAVMIANGSIAGSAAEVAHTVLGPARLQLRARSPNGFDERLLARVEHLPGVKQAAPLLEQTATILAPNGRRVTVDVAGADISLAVLDGLAHTLPIEALSPGGIGLSKTTANELGIPAFNTKASGARSVSLWLRGRTIPMRVTAVLGAETAGALSQARVAVMPLERLQQLAGLQGRITRVLVKPQPGHDAAVRGELQALMGNRLTVASADQDITLLHEALRPSNQASTLFAAISALLGFLFAFNAMLLTVPERRQVIADMRLDGTRRTAIVQMILVQALCLGVIASLVGLLGGYALSLGIFAQSPGYLTPAFTLGTKTVVGLEPVVLAFIGGVLATCLASLVPLLDLRRGRALDAVHHEDDEPGNTLGQRARRRLSVAAASLIVLSAALFAFAPSAAIVACLMLALATVLTVPLVFAGVLRAAGVLARRYERLTVLPIALTSLKATTLRSLALAATGALALFGSIALDGSRDGLLRGIAGFASHYSNSANVWVVNPNDNQAINDFLPGRDAAGIARVPGVAGVNTFQGSFLDVGERRVWVLAWPPVTGFGVLDGQIITGSSAVAAARLREGGWVTVSQQIAAEHHEGVGDTLTLPTPTGNLRLKIAATTTNFGWSPGAIVLDLADYSRHWETTAPTALGINLTPGTNIPAAAGEIQRALGASGLEVLTAQAREARINASAGEGLGQLGEISTLLILAAILAMAAALGSSIWERRISLAGLRLDGTKPRRLRRILLVETMLMLSAGCLTGALAGIYGQIVIDGYLRHVTGFPVAIVATGTRPLEIFALVLATVMIIAAIPGWLASRVPPRLALQDE